MFNRDGRIVGWKLVEPLPPIEPVKEDDHAEHDAEAGQVHEESRP